MIAQLTGTLIEKNPPFLLLDVNGVGYELFATMHTFYQLPECGQRVRLMTHLIIREDAHTLYGFHSHHERALFRTLIKVNGVGPKLALSILSGIEPDAFARCVHDNNITALVRIPGVGKKTAERLLVEMRDKVAEWETGASTVGQAPVSDEAVSALLALGYKPKEAEQAVKHVYQPDKPAEQLIRDALKAMVTV